MNVQNLDLLSFLGFLFIMGLLVVLIRRTVYFRIGLVVACMLVIVSGIYEFFNGTPWSNRIARDRIIQYVQHTYPGEKFTVEDSAYNFKEADYGVRIQFQSDPEVYSFELRADQSIRIWGNGSHHKNG